MHFKHLNYSRIPNILVLGFNDESIQSTNQTKRKHKEEDFQWQKTLKRHKKNISQGLRYPCDKCDYIATKSGNLKTHKETKHQGVRYPCDQCDYIATSCNIYIFSVFVTC